MAKLGFELRSLIPNPMERCTPSQRPVLRHTQTHRVRAICVASECASLLGPPRPSRSWKSIWFGLLPAPVIPPSRKPTLSLTCQAVEPSTCGMVTYQSQKRGLLNLVKNRDSWAPPRTMNQNLQGWGLGIWTQGPKVWESLAPLTLFSFC